MGVVASMHVLGVPLIVFGIILGLFAWFRMIAAASPAAISTPSATAAAQDWRPWIFALLAVVAAGLVLRLIGLDAKGISHPEAYIPGLDLAPGISEPPPRHGFIETLQWHFHSETHPPGYYMAMWAWTQAFGASMFSIRLPEALLGAASIFLIYQVGTLTYGRRVGLIAAVLLALSGFHIFWSQMARMYAPGAFLGLLSTWMLLEIARRREPRRLIEAVYVGSLVCGALTVEFTWALLGVHMVWTALNQNRDRAAVLRLSVLQTAAVMLAAPMLSHAVMTSINGAAERPTFRFLSHYFSFGMLFQHGGYSQLQTVLPDHLWPIVLAFSLVLIGLGLTRASADATPQVAAPRDWPWRLGLCAAAGSAVMLGFFLISTRRVRPMAVTPVLPWLMLLFPVVSARMGPQLRRLAPWLDRFLDPRNWWLGLVPLLAIPPVLGIWMISFKVTLTAPRAFAIFVPYLLILVAAGLERLAPRRVIFALTGAALVATFAWSAYLMFPVPTTPRDYRGLAEAINARSQPGDLIFVPMRNWEVTPMFIYLPHERLVAQRYREALAASPHARVWAPAFHEALPPNPQMNQALAGYRVVGQVQVKGAAALLYAPDPKANAALSPGGGAVQAVVRP